jgi:hypothetical protein
MLVEVGFQEIDHILAGGQFTGRPAGPFLGKLKALVVCRLRHIPYRPATLRSFLVTVPAAFIGTFPATTLRGMK